MLVLLLVQISINGGKRVVVLLGPSSISSWPRYFCQDRNTRAYHDLDAP